MGDVSAEEKARHRRFLENMRRMNELDVEERLADTTSPAERVHRIGDMLDFFIRLRGGIDNLLDPQREEASLALAARFRAAAQRSR